MTNSKNVLNLGCDGCFTFCLPTILPKTFMWTNLSSSYGYLERFL
jgi:hypothetical protein